MLSRATVVEGDGTADWFSFTANQALPAIQRSKEEDPGGFSLSIKSLHGSMWACPVIFLINKPNYTLFT